MPSDILVSNTLTYDLVPPKRPGLGDLQMALKGNSGAGIHRDPRFPWAEEFNQQAAQIAAMSRVNPVALLHVGYVSGVPSVIAVTGCGSRVVSSVFAVDPVSTGIRDVTWPADTFPPQLLPPIFFLADDVDARVPHGAWIVNGVRIKSMDAGGAFANIGAVVAIY
jgi:hypothetical protein